MNKVKTFYVFLLTASIFFLASCSSELSMQGLWQDTNAAGTIEFKKNGDVIIIDNTSATVTGSYKRNGDILTFELTATDIMRDSIQPTKKTIVTANIIKFTADELQLGFSGDTDIEHYKRLR